MESVCYYKVAGTFHGTWPVGSYAANAFGLHDMHGVSERDEDCWHRDFGAMLAEIKQTGAAWTGDNCTFRVIRGGSWVKDASTLRLTNR